MPSRATNALQSIQNAGTVIIADTADFNVIERFKPSEGTTNPSLLYLAAQQPAYSSLLESTIAYAQSLTSSSRESRLELAAEYLAVLFGVEIYHRTGRVSTEVDVRHSFDTPATVAAALRVIDIYAKQGVPKSAVRIKISATWEGIRAARVLEQEHGVSVLVTIVFGLVQAITAAEAGVTCIAPYVGRIGDWHKACGEHLVEGVDSGVLKVQQMQNYFRKYGYKTQVMGASFRSIEQVKSLAGTDLLTVAPSILELLQKDEADVETRLTAATALALELPKVSYINDESGFRWAFNSDACAVEKSADAMRRFAADTDKLKELLASKLELTFIADSGRSL